MPKLNLNRSLRKPSAQTLTKNLQKESSQLFPHLKRNSVHNDEAHIRDLIKTQRFCFEKVINPALKQIDCSRIQNLRFSKSTHDQKELKSQMRSWFSKESRNKENKSSVKNVCQSQAKNMKLNFVQKLQQMEPKKAKIVYLEKEFMEKQMTKAPPNKENKGSFTQRASKAHSKDKVSLCRVATKKQGFPFTTKQYQNLKLREQFEKEEQQLSIIPMNSQEQLQKFISFQSYAQLVAF